MLLRLLSRACVFASQGFHGSLPQVEVFDPRSFRIGDTTRFSPYAGRGFVTQYKKPVKVASRSLAAALQQPFSGYLDAFSFCDVDGSKFSRGIMLHICLQVRARIWRL